MSKRSHAEISPSSSSSSSDADIFTSSTIHDRSSSFTALFSASASYVSSPRTLQCHPSLREASHRVLAWRSTAPTQQKLPFASGNGGATSRAPAAIHSDDDGEKWAGKRLEKVLLETGVEAGVLVVARWYGGVMLGPVRFAHIERVAREAIAAFRAQGGGAPTKKARAEEGRGDGHGEEEEEEEVVRRASLGRILKERDQSISVLRGLLAEKQGLLSGKQRKDVVADGTAAVTQEKAGRKSLPSAPAAPDYNSMAVSKLRGLEKARDATIAWILRQIESVEGELGGMQVLDVGGAAGSAGSLAIEARDESGGCSKQGVESESEPDAEPEGEG